MTPRPRERRSPHRISAEKITETRIPAAMAIRQAVFTGKPRAVAHVRRRGRRHGGMTSARLSPLLESVRLLACAHGCDTALQGRLLRRAPPRRFEQLAGPMHVSGTIEHPAERVEQQRALQRLPAFAAPRAHPAESEVTLQDVVCTRGILGTLRRWERSVRLCQQTEPIFQARSASWHRADQPSGAGHPREADPARPARPGGGPPDQSRSSPSSNRDRSMQSPMCT